jgi:hypothetical protein
MWLKDPQGPTRPHNTGDHLLKEWMVLLHDWLHAWSCEVVFGLLGARATASLDVEELAFIHLCTEACATVGLDYWYLSTFNVNDLIPIGTNEQNFAVDYRETAAAEFRRFDATHDIQCPAFLGKIATFYCSGSFDGFSAADLRQSPVLEKWLTHELKYGQMQRRYTRDWLHFAVGETRRPTAASVRHGGRWQRELLDALGKVLFRLIKDGRDEAVRGVPPRFDVSGRPRRAAFCDLTRLDDDELSELFMNSTPPEQDIIAATVVQRCVWDEVPTAVRPALASCLRERALGALLTALRGVPRVVAPRRRTSGEALFLYA